jgi:hypothetical protein
MIGHAEPHATEARSRHSQNDGAQDHRSPTSCAMVNMKQTIPGPTSTRGFTPSRTLELPLHHGSFLRKPSLVDPLLAYKREGLASRQVGWVEQSYFRHFKRQLNDPGGLKMIHPQG